jgi:hypothetical protein
VHKRQHNADRTKNGHGDVQRLDGVLLLLDVRRCREARRVVSEPNAEDRADDESGQKDVRESEQSYSHELFLECRFASPTRIARNRARRLPCFGRRTADGAGDRFYALGTTGGRAGDVDGAFEAKAVAVPRLNLPVFVYVKRPPTSPFPACRVHRRPWLISSSDRANDSSCTRSSAVTISVTFGRPNRMLASF